MRLELPFEVRLVCDYRRWFLQVMEPRLPLPFFRFSKRRNLQDVNNLRQQLDMSVDWL